MRKAISIFVLLTILLSCEEEGTPLSVSSFTPDKALVGAEVTISGKGFSTTPTENIVTFGTAPAEVVSSTETQIIAKVPTDAQSGTIAVQVGGSKKNAPGIFTVQHAPEILQILSSTGEIGSLLTFITHYCGVTEASNLVKFNGVVAEVVSVATGSRPGDPIAIQSISARIPIASTGKVTIEYDGVEATVIENFIIKPYVTGFSPKGGSSVLPITITGLNFVPGVQVRIGGIVATVSNVTPTSITAQSTARFGLVQVDNSIASEYFMGSDFIGPTPVSGPVGTWVTLYTTGTPRSPQPIVKFNGVQATELDFSTGIKARVPAGATTGKVTMELGVFESMSTGSFTVQ